MSAPIVVLSPHHRRMIGDVVAKTRGRPHALAMQDIETVMETIIRETISDSESGDKIRARDYRRFIIEALSLEQRTENHV